MKAFEIHAFGIENLHLVDREKPQPGPGQVLIRMEAISLNFQDLLLIGGQYIPDLSLPHIPVSDGAGVVEAVGDNVSMWQPGDRVMTQFMQDWIQGPAHPNVTKSFLSLSQPGVLAEYIVLPASGVVRTPAHLSSEEASTLPIAGLTAWAGLVEYGHLRIGQTVLTQGTGGVSIAALQLAKAAGARVIATSGSDQKLEKLKALGADMVINYKANPDWPAEVKRLTQGQGVDLTIDVAGPDSIGKSLQALKVNGTLAFVGVVNGLEASFNVVHGLASFATMKGFQVGSRTMFEQYITALELNQLRPVVDRIFSFDQTQAAFRYLDSGQHVGKVVIKF